MTNPDEPTVTIRDEDGWTHADVTSPAGEFHLSTTEGREGIQRMIDAVARYHADPAAHSTFMVVPMPDGSASPEFKLIGGGRWDATRRISYSPADGADQ